MIKFFDFQSDFQEYRSEYQTAFERVMQSGKLILGEEVRTFEQELAESLGLTHAVGVNSGTDALLLTLKALGVGAGDEVITVSNTAVPTVSAIIAAGAQPCFVDLDPNTLLMDLKLVEQKISPKTRAIIAVHLFGNMVDIPQVMTIAKRHSIAVIEDCAQAQGASLQGRIAGSIAPISCFSFYPTKNLGAFGDGGAIATSDPKLAERTRMLRMYGFGETDRHAHIDGYNSRLDELQAAFLRTKLARLGAAVNERRRLAAVYDESLAGVSGVKALTTTPGCLHGYHLYVVRCERRPILIEAFKKAEIGFGIHYAEPIHKMEFLRRRGFEAGPLPETEQAAEAIISLPLYPGLKDAEQAKVIAVVCQSAG